MQENIYIRSALFMQARHRLILTVSVVLAIVCQASTADARHKHSKQKKAKKEEVVHQDVRPRKYPRLSQYYPLAQDGLGGISGRVMGNLVPAKATRVVLMHDDKMVTKTVTDDDGNFIFKYITPGEYCVIATKAGFKTSSVTNITVIEDNLTRTDFYMPKVRADEEVNSLSETYEMNWKFMKEN